MQTGDRFAGRYVIERQIGAGGMGHVFQALDQLLDRRVAVKVISPERTQDPKFVARFRHEASAAAKLEHANVVPVYHCDEHDGVLYMVMRFVPGSDLQGALRIAGSFDPGRTVALIEQVAAGLHAAHERGIIHRDVKPGNVLLERNADGHEKAWVTDFGIAHSQQLAGHGLTPDGFVVGTPEYMAPELLRGAPASIRSDVYALACLTFECLAGRKPFQGTQEQILQERLSGQLPDLRRLAPALPEGVVRAVERGLSEQPSGRPTDAKTFAIELAAGSQVARTIVLEAGRESSDPGPGADRRDHRPRAVRRWAGVAVGVVVLASAGGTILAWASSGAGGSSPGPVPTRSPSDGATTAAELRQALAARLPVDVFTGCRPQPEGEGDGKVASVACSSVTDGADELLVTQWQDSDAMLASFNRSMSTRPIGKCRSYDGTPPIGVKSTWGPTSTWPLACYVNVNRHVVLLWEYPEQALQVIAVNHDMTASPALFSWWQRATLSPIR